MKKVLGIACCFVMLFLAGHANALDIKESEPNDNIGQAQNIDAFFSLGVNPDIHNPTTIPWVSISGTGDGTTSDYYAITVPAPGLGIFDIDYGDYTPVPTTSDFDAWLELYDSGGVLLGVNDDAYPTLGAGGSAYGLDSYLQYTFAAPGTYYIGVGQYPSLAPIRSGGVYELQVSLEHPVPEPGTIILLGAGLLGLLALGRKKFKK